MTHCGRRQHAPGLRREVSRLQAKVRDLEARLNAYLDGETDSYDGEPPPLRRGMRDHDWSTDRDRGDYHCVCGVRALLPEPLGLLRCRRGGASAFARTGVGISTPRGVSPRSGSSSLRPRGAFLALASVVTAWASSGCHEFSSTATPPLRRASHARRRRELLTPRCLGETVQIPPVLVLHELL